MENSTTEDGENTPLETRNAPVVVTVVDGTEAVAHDAAEVVVAVATAVVDATKVVVGALVRAGDELGRDLQPTTTSAPPARRPHPEMADTATPAA
jgi:hypothetical protein